MGSHIYQHYVPKFYLREFRDSNENIHCFRKSEQRKFKKSASDDSNLRIACGELFYDDTEDKKLEQAIGNIFEGSHSHAYNELCDMENPRKLSDRSQQMMVHFITFQYARTRRQRDELKEAAQQHEISETKNEDISEEAKRVRDSAKTIIKDAKSENGARLHHPIIMNVISELFTETLLEHGKMTMFVNKTEIPYCTSDHPATQYKTRNPTKFDHGDAIGVAGKDWEIYLPLTPELSLGIIDKRESPYSGVHKIESKNKVLMLNKLQMEHSSELIVCSDNNYTALNGLI